MKLLASFVNIDTYLRAAQGRNLLDGGGTRVRRTSRQPCSGVSGHEFRVFAAQSSVGRELSGGGPAERPRQKPASASGETSISDCCGKVS
jgi:hypothetical protein